MARRRIKSPLEGIQADEVAKKRVWAVLQVLSGQMGVTAAAGAGQISVTRYYQLEQKALRSMVYALSPEQGKGRGTPMEQMERLRKKQEELETENGRQRQLLRMARKLWGPLADAETKRPLKKAAGTAPEESPSPPQP